MSVKSGKVKRVWNCNQPWENEHGSFQTYGVEFEDGFAAQFNVKDGFDPKFKAGETGFYSIRMSATEKFPAKIKHEKDPESNSYSSGGGKKGGGGYGRPQDPILEMVKNAAVQTTHIISPTIAEKGIPTKEIIMGVMKNVFECQTELYNAAKNTSATPDATSTQPAAQSSSSSAPFPNEEDDLPFMVSIPIILGLLSWIPV